MTVVAPQRYSPGWEPSHVGWYGRIMNREPAQGEVVFTRLENVPGVDVTNPTHPVSVYNVPGGIVAQIGVENIDLGDGYGPQPWGVVRQDLPGWDSDVDNADVWWRADIRLTNGESPPPIFFRPEFLDGDTFWLNVLEGSTGSETRPNTTNTRAEFLALKSGTGAGGVSKTYVDQGLAGKVDITDTRLSDTRTPKPHATTHGAGGSDALSLSATQLTSGVVAPARLGTGWTGNGSMVLADNGTWITAAAGGSTTDPTAVHKTGNESIDGVKTFTSAPVVPDSSWSIAKTNALQATLDGKAALTHAARHTAGGADPISVAASQITGVIPPAKLGTGTTGATTILYGDGVWRAAPTGSAGTVVNNSDGTSTLTI